MICCDGNSTSQRQAHPSGPMTYEIKIVTPLNTQQKYDTLCIYRFYSVPVECGVLRSVCLSVHLSVREHISGTVRPIFTKFFMQIPCGRDSVLL